MNREFFDSTVAIVMILWFFWLIAWPYAVVLGSAAWGVGAGVFLRLRRPSLAAVCLAVAALVLGTGVVVLVEAEDMVIGVLPSPLRPAGHVAFVSLPLAAWIAGLLWVAATLWRRGSSPNRTIDADRLPAGLRPPANGRSS
jgi:hypothetical protein